MLRGNHIFVIIFFPVEGFVVYVSVSSLRLPHADKVCASYMSRFWKRSHKRADIINCRRVSSPVSQLRHVTVTCEGSAVIYWDQTLSPDATVWEIRGQFLYFEMVRERPLSLRMLSLANRAFENVSYFKYFGARITNQILTHGEIKNRLNLGNSYHSVHRFCLLVCCLKL
jgi:hypothetical protein